MSSTMDQSLLRATTATFEELALLVPDPDPATDAAPLDFTVSLEFRGPVNGRLVLRASSDVLPRVAANMLGVQQGRQPGMQRDAMAELSNVICGNVLPDIAGAEAVFHLHAPRVHHDGTSPSRDSDLPQARVLLGIEGGLAEVSLYLFQSDGETVAGTRGARVA